MIFGNPHNFDPRVGLAYRITKGNRPLVVRGGYSVFQFGQPLRFFSGYTYTSVPQGGLLNVSPDSAVTSPDGKSNYLLRAAPTVVAGVNTANIIDPSKATGILPGTGSVSFVSPHLADPRAQEWNVTFEKELMSNTAFSVGYIGTRGSNLATYNMLNDQPADYLWYTTTGQQLPTRTYADVATRPYDQQVYGTIREKQSIVSTNTQSFKTEVEHRISNLYASQLF